MSDKKTRSPRRGSLPLGILGAFLGAFLTMAGAAALWSLLCPAGGAATNAFLWLMVMTAPVSCLGYRLFRGRRSRRAALGAVIPAVLLACGLAVPALLLYNAWRRQGVPLAVLLEAVDWREFWTAALVDSQPLGALCVAIGALGLLLFRGIVLNYADWERSPWRVAYAGGNGATYNYPPQFLPASPPPGLFRVGGRLEVDGEKLRTLPLLGRGKCFSAEDIAGAVIGPSNGCNVLYDKEHEILATFAWSMYGADALASYLLEKQVPISAPPDLSPLFRRAPPPTLMAPERFTLTLPARTVRQFHLLGAVFLALAAVLLGVLAFLWGAGLLGGTLWFPLVCGCLCLIIGFDGWLFLRVAGKHRLEVDGEKLRFVSRMGRRREFTAGDIWSASWHAGFYELQDKDWRTLARLDPGLEDLELLRPYMEEHCPKMQIRESPVRRH